MKRNRALAVIIAFVMTVCVGAFFACGKKSGSSKPADNNKPGNKEYSVTFEYNYEGAPTGHYLVEKVSSGTTVSKPDDPARDDYVFDFWSSDGNGEKRYNFSSLVTANVTLYAQWKLESTLTLTEIVITRPSKTVYTVGEQLDTTGLTVTAKYSNGSQKAVPLDRCNITGFSSAEPGTVPVTVSYGGKSKSFDVTVNSGDVKPGECTVTFYYNYTGASQSVYKTQKVNSGERVESPAKPERTGYGFNGWYTEEQGGSQYTFSSPVTSDLKLYARWTRNAPVLTGITVTQQPTKLVYEFGESFDPAGMKVTAQYDYGENNNKNIEDSVDTQVDMSVSGERTVTVSYTNNKVTKTATFTVTVKPAVRSLSVTKMPAKTVYTVGDEFDPDGLEITAAFDEGEPEVLPSSRYILEGYKANEVREQTITVKLVTDASVYTTFKVRVDPVPSSYTVTFYLNYTPTSEDVYKTVSGIEPGDHISEPAAPAERTGYEFNGWYTDRAGNNAYVFGTAINANVALYADWTKKAAVLTGITVTPIKTEYIVGQSINKATDLTVIAHYTDIDGTTDRPLAPEDFTLTPPATMGTAGENKTVAVSYTDVVEKRSEYTISVINRKVEKVEYTKGNTFVTQYYVGDSFSPAGLTFSVTYNDATVEHPDAADITYTSHNGTLSAGKFTAAGDIVITPSYGSKNGSTFTVKVSEVKVVRLIVSGTPTVSQYIKGQSFDPAGLVFTAEYNNGQTPTHPDADMDIVYSAEEYMSGRVFIKSGDPVLITAKYESIEASTKISVKVTAPVLENEKWYLLGDFNSWGVAEDTGEYMVTRTESAGKTVYTSGYITLAKDYAFKIAKCKDNTAATTAERFYGDSWITISGGEENYGEYLSIDPVVALLEMEVDGDDNLKVVAIDAGVKDRNWVITYTVTATETKVNITLDYVDTRAPKTGEHDLTVTENTAPRQSVYLAGNFSGNFKLCDRWSSGNANIASVHTVGGHTQYFFTGVYLKKYDSFKVVTVDNSTLTWMGGTFSGLGSSKKISLGTGDDYGNIYLGAAVTDGLYNLVYDVQDSTLTVYESKEVSVLVGSVYDTHTPQKSDLTVKYGGAEVPDADYTLIAPAAVVGDHASTLTVLVYGVEYIHEYTAVERVIQSISVTAGPSDTSRYACENITPAEIEVTATYDNGDTRTLLSNEYTVSDYAQTAFDEVTKLEDKLNGYITTSVTVTLKGTELTATINNIKLYNHATRLVVTAADTAFYAGDTVSKSDLTVKIIFNEDDNRVTNVTMNVPASANYEIKNGTLKEGDNTVNVEYEVSDGKNSLELKGSVVINAAKVAPIAIRFVAPDETPLFRAGYSFLGTGYTFFVTYNNGDEDDSFGVSSTGIKLASDYLDGLRFIFPAGATEQLTRGVEITLSYEEDGVEVFAQHKIIVDLDVSGGTVYRISFESGLNSAYKPTNIPKDPMEATPADPYISYDKTPECKGFVFAGWEDDEGKSVVLNNYKVVRDVIIRASWNPAANYTVVYDMNGGGVNPNTVTSFRATDLVYPTVTLSDATRDFYRFDGWFTAAVGGDRISVIDYSRLPENGEGTSITVYAHWTILTYTLKYAVGDYGTAISNKTFTIDTIATVSTLPVPQINTTGQEGGWYFIGWKRGAEANSDNAVIDAEYLRTLSGTEMTVVAHYSDIYTVIFDPDQGKIGTSSEPVTVELHYDTAIPAADKPADPTYEGNTFDGWHLVGADNKLAAAAFDFTSKIKANITLRAKWIGNPQNGTFLRGTVNNWGEGGGAVYSATLEDGKYVISHVPLATGDVFQLATYVNFVQTNWIKPENATISSSSAPAGAVEFKTVEDVFGGYNYIVTVNGEAFENKLWTLKVSATSAHAELEAASNATRSPDGTVKTLTVNASPNADVYIMGSFNGYKTVDEWSSASSVVPTAKVGTKYYFGNVMLKNYDQIKLYKPTGNVWLGGTFKGLGSSNKITLGDGDNLYLIGIADGYYDIVFDSSDSSLIIDAHKELTAVKNANIFVGATPNVGSFTYTYGGESAAAAAVTLVSPAAAVSGRNTIKAVCGNTVAVISYDATEVVSTGITVTQGAGFKTAYTVGEAFNSSGLTVKLVYNNGNEQELAYGTGYTVSAIPKKANVSNSFTQSQSVSLTLTVKVSDELSYEESINITLSNVLKDIEISRIPTPTTPEGYYQTDSYSDVGYSNSGLEVNAVFNKDIAGADVVKQVLDSEDYTVSEPDLSSAGEKTVTVTFIYNGVTYTKSFTINVLPLNVESISVSGGKVQFKVGEAMDSSAVTVTGAYNDGNDRPITAGVQFTVDGEHYDSVNGRFIKAGVATVTVTHTSGKITSYTVDVDALTVSYNVMDGTFAAGIESSVTISVYGTAFTPVKNTPTDIKISRAHYSFGGWFTESGCASDKAWTDGAAVTADVTLYAKWIPDVYTVTFLCNDGTTDSEGDPTVYHTEEVTYSAVCRVEAPRENPKRASYNFRHWSLDPDETDSVEFGFETTLIDRDITLYAIWTDAHVYDVVFNSNGGTAVDTQHRLVGTKADKPADPTRTGYKFNGWVLESTQEPFSFDTPITRDYTLKATWQIKTYNVTFDLNYEYGAGITPPPAQSVQYDKLITEPDRPVRTGYEFLGWKYGVEQAHWVFATRKMPADGDDTVPFVLKADWQAKTLTVIYDVKGGTPAIANGSVVFGQKITPPADPGKEGYSFGGWKLKDATSAWDFENDVMTLDRTITLYAIWNVQSYAISFVSDGENVQAGYSSLDYGATITAPAVSKPGYTLLGWYDRAVGENTLWNFTTGKMPAKALTLVAKWEANKYSLTYVNGNGAQTNSEVEYGAPLTPPAPAVKVGYDFVGWKDDGGSSYTTMPIAEEGLTLTATYELIKYTLEYRMGDYANAIASVVDFTVADWKGVGTLPAAAAVVINTAGTNGGWYFTGWTLGATGDAVTGITLEHISGITADAQHKASLYVVANYDNHYTVTFNVNKPAVSAEVQNPPEPVSVVYNGKVAALTTPPTLGGFVLDGWYTSATPAATATAFAFGTAGDAVTADITLYAKWVKAPPENGVYLLGTFNGWELSDDNILHYKAKVSTENGADKYEVNGIALAKDNTMKFVAYESGKALDYKETYGRTIYCPSGLTVNIDTSSNNNLTVTAITPITAKDTYSIIWGKNGNGVNYVSFVRETRDPSFGDTVINNTDTATAAVYIRGSMTNGFGLNNNWSSDSAVIDVVHDTKNGNDKYYFQKLYLVPADSFQMYVTQGDKWYGKGYIDSADGSIDVSKLQYTGDYGSDITNLPEAAYYNFVFDNKTSKLTIYKWAALTSGLKTDIYGEQTPNKNNINVWFGGAAVPSVTDAMLYEVDSVNKTYTVLYRGEFGTFGYTTVAVAPESLDSVTIAPAKTKYKPGETVDLTGITVSGTNNDGSAFTASAADFDEVVISNTAAGSGRDVFGEYDKEITLRLTGTDLTLRYTVKVYNELSSIEVTANPNRLSFVKHTAVDYTGLKITAKFNTGKGASAFTLELNASEYTLSPAQGTVLTDAHADAGNNVAVTVKSGTGLACGEKTTGFSVQVTEPVIATVSVSGTPVKEFRVGDLYENTPENRNGLTFTATYNNGLDATAALDLDLLAFSWGANANNYKQVKVSGQIAVLIRYGDIDVTGSVTATVKNKVTSIVITTPAHVPDKNNGNWVVGDRYKTAGMVISVTYNGDVEGATSNTVPYIEEGFTVKIGNETVGSSGVELQADNDGNIAASITYGNLTTSFNIYVETRKVIMVTASGTLTKTTYTVGEVFSGDGLTFTAKYNNGDVANNFDRSRIHYEYEQNGSEQFKTAGNNVAVVAKCDSLVAGEYAVTVVNKLTSIEVKQSGIPTPPSTPAGRENKWIAGDRVTLIGMVVTLHYNAGVSGADSDITDTLTVSSANLSRFSAELSAVLVEGTNNYTVTLDGTFECTLTINAAAKTIKSFAVSGTPADQFKDSTFVATGLTFTATYNNGDTETVTTGITYTASNMTDGVFTAAGTNITVTAAYKGKTCTITGVNVAADSRFTVSFDTGEGGTPIASQTVDYRGKATIPAQPTRKGYNFAGWTKGGAAYYFDTEVTSNIELVAAWTAKTYTVEYYDGATLLNTAELNGGNPFTYTANGDNSFVAVELGNAAKRHYSFIGWYSESDFSGSKVTALSYGLLPATGTSVKLYARFNIKSYNVELHYNYGSPETVGTKTVTCLMTGDALLLPTAATMLRNGYEFKGWYTKANPSASDSAIQSVVLRSDADAVEISVFYAKWTAKNVNVELHYNYGSPETVNTKTVTCVSSLTERTLPGAADMLRNGYEFKGWYESAAPADGDTAYTVIEFSNNLMTTPGDLYAKWAVKSVKVTLNANYVGAAPAYTEASYNCEQTGDDLLLPNPAARSGYDFDGWYTVAQPSASDSAVTAVSFKADNSGLVANEFYAKWKAKEVAVNLHYNYGSPETVDIKTVTCESTGSELALPTAATMLRSGYEFKGWYTKAEPSATDSAVTAISFGSNNLISTATQLYAKWDIKTYTVNFEAKDGTATGYTDNKLSYVVTDGTVSLTGEATPKSGMRFIGWYSAGEKGEGVTKVESVNIDSFGANDSITVWAWYEPDTVKVTFNANSGTLTGSATVDVTIGSAVDKPTDPKRAGYAFKGWFNASSGGTQWKFSGETGANTVTDATTLYAQWTQTNGVYVDDVLRKALVVKTTNVEDVAHNVKLNNSETFELYRGGSKVTFTLKSNDVVTDYFSTAAGDNKTSVKTKSDGGGYYELYYKYENNGSNNGLWIERKGALSDYQAPAADLGGIYSGTTSLKAFTVNEDTLNEIMATSVQVGTAGSTGATQTAITVKYGGASITGITLSCDDGIPASLSGSTVYLLAGNYDFYYNYKTKKLHIGGTPTGKANGSISSFTTDPGSTNNGARLVGQFYELGTQASFSSAKGYWMTYGSDNNYENFTTTIYLRKGEVFKIRCYAKYSSGSSYDCWCGYNNVYKDDITKSNYFKADSDGNFVVLVSGYYSLDFYRWQRDNNNAGNRIYLKSYSATK